MNWDDLRYFLAVAAAGSLSAAAQQLGVNTTTVLRRVGSLEEDLNARLFDRERTGYRLTEAGERLVASLEPVDRKLATLARDFAAAEAGGTGQVRIALSELVASEVLTPGLSDFLAGHPGIAVELVLDLAQYAPPLAPRISSPLKDVDIAIRTSRPTQGDMLVRKLGEIGFGLYGAESYFAEAGRPVSMSGLSSHRLIGFPKGDPPLGPVWWMTRAEKGAHTVYRASSDYARLAAVKAGAGLAALPCVLGDREPGVDCLFGPDQVGSLEIWLLTRTDLAQLSHVRAAMEFVVTAVRDMRPALSGIAGKVTEHPLEAVQARHKAETVN